MAAKLETAAELASEWLLLAKSIHASGKRTVAGGGVAVFLRWRKRHAKAARVIWVHS
jgi:hypothetical protein